MVRDATRARPSRHGLLALALVCAWLPMSAERSAAQTTTSTTLASTTTTSTTTSTTLPVALQEAFDDLESFKGIAAALGACDVTAVQRKVQTGAMQRKCEATPSPRKQTQCERKVKRVVCRARDEVGACKLQVLHARPGLTASDPTMPPDRNIPSDLLELLSDSANSTGCMFGGPVYPIGTELRCVRKGKKLPPPSCPDASCGCVTGGLQAISDALVRAIDCREKMVSKIFTGDTFDEATCMTNAWATCRAPAACDEDPCYDLPSLCTKAREFAERALNSLAFTAGCAVRGPGACEDGNPCTVDRCDGKDCQHTDADGTACTAGEECKVGVCDGGQCMIGNAGDGVACADDANPCTDDVCKMGACSHSGTAKFGQTCGNSACMVCGLNAANKVSCVPRTCDDRCICVEEDGLGCVMPGGSGMKCGN